MKKLPHLFMRQLLLFYSLNYWGNNNEWQAGSKSLLLYQKFNRQIVILICYRLIVEVFFRY